jgi:hypothetical protein
MWLEVPGRASCLPLPGRAGIIRVMIERIESPVRP